MSEPIKQTIGVLQDEVREHEEELRNLKRMINSLCKKAGLDVMYSDAEISIESSVATGVRADQFYGQALATAVRDILERRKALNQGAATVNEIYASLKAGGYNFETKNDDNAKRNLRISLAKNTSTFHRLPNGQYGMLSWYPNVKIKKQEEDGTEDGESGEDEVDEDARPKK